MEVLSDGLRRELDDFNVSVSIVQPAFVDTAIFGKVSAVSESMSHSVMSPSFTDQAISICYSVMMCVYIHETCLLACLLA